MPVAAGEVQTFERLFHDHYHVVLGYALRRVDVAAAQDIADETFLIAWRRRLDIPAAAELPWLLSVTRNLTGQHHRGGSRDEALTAEVTRLQAFGEVGPGDPDTPASQLTSAPPHDVAGSAGRVATDERSGPC